MGANGVSHSCKLLPILVLLFGFRKHSRQLFTRTSPYFSRSHEHHFRIQVFGRSYRLQLPCTASFPALAPIHTCVGSLLRLVSSVPLTSFQRGDASLSSAVLSILLLCSYAIRYKKRHSLGVPGLEDRRHPQVFKGPLAERVHLGLKPGDREMVVELGAGTSALPL